jgi:hypothetical protein
VFRRSVDDIDAGEGIESKVDRDLESLCDVRGDDLSTAAGKSLQRPKTMYAILTGSHTAPAHGPCGQSWHGEGGEDISRLSPRAFRR